MKNKMCLLCQEQEMAFGKALRAARYDAFSEEIELLHFNNEMWLRRLHVALSPSAHFDLAFFASHLELGLQLYSLKK